ncbi:MAG TPA: hypothetical protein VLS89_19235 [Candidatus Nanopelagicales bacterium]|nr:hypothetical protein [Candidatus Nanopelagicales bacterium]
MSSALWEQLKTRQIAFLRARLVSEQGARDFRARLPEGWAALMATPFGELTEPAALNRAIDAATSGPASRAARPVATAALAAIDAALRADPSAAGDYVPAAAREKLERLAARPQIVPEKLVRELLESEAMDEVMQDVMAALLRDFSQRVNPFVAEWGLPSLLKKLSPFGFGGLGKGLESTRAEFEKRLEPEINRFLRSSSRRALRETSDALVQRAGQPKHVALRKHLAAWTLEQRFSELLSPLDGEASALAHEMALDVVEHVLGRQDVAARRREAVLAFYIEHRTRPVGEVLERLGVKLEPDFDAIGGVVWPLVRAACESPPVQAWLEGLVAEFFDGLPDELG